MKKDKLLNVGKNAKQWRRYYTTHTQKTIADLLGCSIENISAFENGRNDSAYILLMYINLGFDPQGDYNGERIY